MTAVERKADGRIIAFYSYKGGTGRSMALANIAWILASHGKRVLAIDWDLEAPGLHRYFHPFLEDPELGDSPGLIDYAHEFAEASRIAARQGTDAASAERWHEPFLSLLRYSYPLRWDFNGGTLDLVPAGQQGPSYAMKVNAFDWRKFYEELGGGVLLEGLKQRLRNDYDYVLIDSRTGISDTSGICTVQMPDELAVCVTLNRQSLLGAAAVADSALAQRRRPSGEPSLRIWPVVTRVELAEKDRLEAGRLEARATFARHLGHLPRTERAEYWGETEILYQPYFAYEETLAVFAERRRQRASMLGSLENLTRYLSTGREISELAPMSEEARQRGMRGFRRENDGARATHAARKPGRIFVSFAREDFATTQRIARALTPFLGDLIWWEGDEVLPGDDFERKVTAAFEGADIVLACFGPGWLARSLGAGTRMFEPQLLLALSRGQRVVPLLLQGVSIEAWLKTVSAKGLERLGKHFALQLSSESKFGLDIDKLATDIGQILERDFPVSAAPTPAIDPDDPQKGQWGGQSHNDTRQLIASVSPITADWFSVDIELSRTGGEPLEGPVEFHLHPTFTPTVQTVRADGSSAKLSLRAWGAFTAGVRADDGKTTLELDLSLDSSFPHRFRAR